MSFEFSLMLPIRPHFKKMIAKTNAIDPFVIRCEAKCYYSQIIYNNLTTGYTHQKAINPENFSDQLHLHFGPEMAKSKKVFYSLSVLNSIDKALAGIFEERLYEYLNLYCEGKGDIKKHVQKFMEFYEITEDDYQSASLVKKYYRYRKKTKDKDTYNFRRLKENQQESTKKTNNQEGSGSSELSPTLF